MTDQNHETPEQNVRAHRFRAPRYAAALSLLACAAMPLSAATGQLVAHTMPSYVSTAKNLGPADPSATLDVSVWLKLHNRGELDALAHQLYDRTSPHYRHWLKPSELTARFAPSAQEAAAVQKFFESHNLKVVTVGPGNLFVRARGTIGDVQKAFQVQLNNYDVRGTTYRAPANDPYVDGPAVGLARAVAGLDSGFFTHPLVQRPSTLPVSGAGVKANSSDGFTTHCFTGIKTEKYSSEGSTFPKAAYRGNSYFGSANNPSPGCGYEPANLQAAYNLTGLYKEGLDGAGQTIAIIDWCGSPTVESDANAFSLQYGLPMLTSSNFTITEVPFKSTCSGPDLEINLDVEWSHAVAPGASINLVVPPSATFQDTDEAESYIVVYGLASVISASYGSAESETPPTILENENLIAEMAAVSGISANFSSGDAGDFTADGIPPTVSAPADGTYATAVGGVSVALNSDNSIAWQTGWGNDETLLVVPGLIFDPPLAEGFAGGSGGGASGYFPLPSYQSGLPGTMRQMPDISWVADPFTGVVVAITEPGQAPAPTYSVVGGTSVACPMFSALWAIANEAAGMPLGQAAAYLYSLPAGAVTDVLPVNSPSNVTANIHQTSTGSDRYSSEELMGGSTGGGFYSALWNYPYEGGVAFVVSFGTDCATVAGDGTACSDPTALTTAAGWDNVTGVGTPNAKAFVDSFKP